MSQENNNMEIEEQPIENPIVTKEEPTEESNQIITLATKKDPEFQKSLALLARSDAHHDLPILTGAFNNNPTGLSSFNSGIPVPAQSYYHEGDALASVITSLPDSNKETKMLDIFYNVPNKTNDSSLTESIITVGYNNETLFNYGVVKFVIESSTNKDFKNPNTGLKEPLTPCRENIGKTFCENTKLCGDGLDAAIIVDFNQHGFISKLKNGESSNYNIHYLMTPEVVNDPAGKTTVNDKNVFTNGPGKGVNMFSYVQTNISNTPYTSFNEDDPITSNNFFSNYNFNLSPIKQIYTKQKAEKLITTLDINYTLPNGQPLTDTIEDSKGENSISTVLGYIKKILDKMKANSRDNSLNFNFNSKCQQKRGGDWFQVLSCLDIKTREFTQILPERGTSKPLTNMPVYFVSHDRIAVAYALLNGANVIYLDYYGNVFVFKNKADKLLKGSGKDIEEILFNGIKENPDFDLDNLIESSKNYQTLRQMVIKNQLIDEFITNCNNIKTTISSINNTNYYLTIEENIKLLFKQAVRLFFVKTNFIDISKEIEFIQTNKATLDGEYSADKKSIISNLMKCISTLKFIQDKFGKIASGQIDNTYTGIVNSWLPINLSKLDVYRAVNNLFSGTGTDDEKKVKFDVRLLNFGNDTDKRISDRFIFLPFIQTLGNIEVVNDTTMTGGIDNIIEVMNILISKTKDYDAYLTQKNTSTSFFSRLSRSGNLSGEQINFNKVANFIYEAIVLLNNIENTTTVIDYTEIKNLAFISESTDSIVVSEDIYEIALLRDEGKNTNDTSDTNDTTPSTVTVGGGYYYYFDQGSKKESIICDVSIKQITWPLLNSIILTDNSNCVRSVINNFKSYFPRITNDNGELLTQLSEILQELSSNTSSSAKRSRDIDESEERNVQPSFGGDGNSVTQPLLQDFNFGYHPLLPIYMILSPYWYQLGPKFQSNSFYNTYFTYYNILEKMEDVITSTYLSDPSNIYNIISGYFIGFALKTFFFTSNTNEKQTQKLLEVLEIDEDEYYMISSKNAMFSNLINGDIVLTDEETTFGITLIESDLFKNFINEVDIKSILQQGTETENIPEYNVLQDKVYNMLSKISIKMNIDRDTPQNNINKSTLTIASTTEEQEQEQEQEQEPSTLIKGKDLAMGVQRKFPSLARQFTSTVRPSRFSTYGVNRAQGGKLKSKKYKMKKNKITRKPKLKKKNKTKKNKKVHRRTIKR